MASRDRMLQQAQRARLRHEGLMSDLWTLTRCYPSLDPERLARAIEATADAATRLDYRTRLLIRDSLTALERHWGRSRMTRWLRGSSARQRIEAIRTERFSEIGFPSLQERIMPGTDPERVKMFLQDLGGRLSDMVRLEVGGSMALILMGRLTRGTEDIDVVDEVPAAVRQLKARTLNQLMKRYGLRLAHFQSHYLPSEWKNRLRYFDEFGCLRVYLVDGYDVFLSKLFSGREKDRDDLIVLAPQLRKDVMRNRLRAYALELNAEPSLHQHAARNWAILYNGEPLPMGE
ncbi:MAG: DUF6036 family nucleotidyltransferase [Gemmataceae bacterium]